MNRGAVKNVYDDLNVEDCQNYWQIMTELGYRMVPRGGRHQEIFAPDGESLGTYVVDMNKIGFAMNVVQVAHKHYMNTVVQELGAQSATI